MTSARIRDACGGNVKQIQRQLEMDQKAMLKEALELTKGLEPFWKWSIFMGRQIVTMRMQFHDQLKEFHHGGHRD